jgi:DNA-binding CsgD family transcriptional regulator
MPQDIARLHTYVKGIIPLSFLASHNIDSHYLKTFLEYFALTNPWNNTHWSKIGSGVVALSEEVAPARLFSRTEFYNDWLTPQGAEAAAGVKIDGDRGQTIRLSMHFPLSQADTYSRATTEVMLRTRGNLLRSIEVGRLMNLRSEEAAAGAALVERGQCAAFVIDRNRRVRTANQQAADLFAAGKAIAVKLGQVHLSGKDADDSFGKALSALSGGTPVDGSRISFRDGESAWQVTLAGLPIEPPPAGILSLLPPHRLVLVLVADLSAVANSAGDLSVLSSTFGLTRAEVLFCRQLLLGDSVADAADHLGITVGTARTRIKTIFHKTGTSRQGELMLFLARLA